MTQFSISNSFPGIRLFGLGRISKVLRNFLVGYLMLHLLAVAILVWFLTGMLRDQMLRDTRDQMNAMAVALSQHIRQLDKGMDDDRLAEHLKQLGEQTGIRFTLINAAGLPIADSNPISTDETGYLGDRPEVWSATPDKPGFSVRHSNRLGIPTLYLAVTYQPKPGQAGGYIRVATSAVAMNAAIDELRKFILLFAIGFSLVAALVTSLFSNYLLRPLGHFSEAARKIGIGQYDAVPTLHSRNDEWGSLADAFRQMQSELNIREQSILENRDRLEAVLSSMIEGVVAMNAKRQVQIANRAACRMFSLTEPELIERNLLDVIRIPELNDAIDKTQETHQYSRVEFETIGKEPRRTISARVSVLPGEIRKSGKRPGIVAVFHDVTELRQLENMRRDFVANVSHELKTPLTSIKACAETLRLGAIHDDQKNMYFVDQIEANAELLDLQIQDLLHLARVESGTEHWNIQPISINDLCLQCVAQFESEAKSRNVQLLFQPNSNSPTARADFDGLATILKNLISNAIHYTPAGGTVEIVADIDDNELVLCVIDTGIGISKKHQLRIFERFYRVDAARSREAGGTGLGLAIVKHLATAFGGAVELQSGIGKGSTFTVRLPAN